MFICDTDTGNLLNYVYEVMCDDVVKNEFALLAEVYCVEILWSRREIVAWARTASWLETEVLQSDEPGEGQQISHYNIRPHHVKHALFTL